ncbi:8-amino-7-oxononanoate synthase [Alteromonas sp. KUL106]|uniref:aminotransferase class I/II-fold pyridoxal phosphate-dependent enzyme n=1 Tax=Alteromonas sp. KUL106 TaxID=2480799 RepID=UPI0012E55C44|nr:8-amino-7-oxononanoate synthase [Alteromonas sp. KUL106]GFD69614.1 8-amino-7-oxononanoate synthase [Alteromonas sp. KUL106]GFD80609.1 8-amino-7-oxononanoate synthase [Tenacibaculum sp. KUL118]
MAFNWLDDALSERAQQGLLRQRQCQQYEKDSIICINGEHYLNFSSNDYLGMRQHEGVLQSWVEGLAQFGGGSGASPLVTGHTQAHLALEAYIADGLNREAALLFNSGFAANQALCMALFPHLSHPNKGASAGLIIADKLMHASFLEGAQCVSENAKLRRFKHNDLSHLESVLSSACHKHVSNADRSTDANAYANTHTNQQDMLIASEGVFSMDGDVAPCKGIAELAAQYNAWFMLDDAHGMGVLGDNGFGTAEALNLTQQEVPIVMGTFGKAVGTAGAFIAGSQTLIDYLVNFSKHYVYSTAMPPAQAVATLYSLTHIASDTSRRETLNSNIAYFKTSFHQRFGQTLNASGKSDALSQITLGQSQSAIQPIIVGCPARAIALSDGLKQRGIWATAIRQPTIPKKQDRLRITLTSNHTTQDIDVLIDAIELSWNNLAITEASAQSAPKCGDTASGHLPTNEL